MLRHCKMTMVMIALMDKSKPHKRDESEMVTIAISK